MSAEQQPPTGEAVQSLYSGVDHNASWERSYNADGRVFINPRRLHEAWEEFHQNSQRHGRRRAIMRCYVTQEVLNHSSHLPIEAVVPMGNEYLIWIGQNQHPQVSTQGPYASRTPSESTPLHREYYLDTEVNSSDIDQLIELWGQFGWTPQAIRNFVRNNANGNPIALIRTMEQEAVGVMIAESAEFGAHRLVEITELAVHPDHRGQHLASVLIRELSRLSLERWEDALVFGEYNLTTRSYQSAARASQLPAVTGRVDGVLRDHVGIATGEGNQVIAPWDTQWLHNFLVMYQPNRRLHRYR